MALHLTVYCYSVESGCRKTMPFCACRGRIYLWFLCHSFLPVIYHHVYWKLKKQGICGFTIRAIYAWYHICPCNVVSPVTFCVDLPSSRRPLSHVPSELVTFLWGLCMRKLGSLRIKNVFGYSLASSAHQNQWNHKAAAELFLVFILNFPSILPFPSKSWWIGQNNVCGLSWWKCSSDWTRWHHINRANAWLLQFLVNTCNLSWGIFVQFWHTDKLPQRAKNGILIDHPVKLAHLNPRGCECWRGSLYVRMLLYHLTGRQHFVTATCCWSLFSSVSQLKAAHLGFSICGERSSDPDYTYHPLLPLSKHVVVMYFAKFCPIETNSNLSCVSLSDIPTFSWWVHEMSLVLFRVSSS